MKGTVSSSLNFSMSRMGRDKVGRRATAKNWSDLCNFYGKVIFWNFVLENIMYFSLLNLTH